MDTTPELTPEQSMALRKAGDELAIVDPATNQVYVVVAKTVHEMAKAAMNRQREDSAAIRKGIEDLKAGRVIDLDEAHQEIKTRFAQQYGSEV